MTNIRTRESFEQDREFDDDDDYYYDPNLEEDVARIEDDSPYPEVRCAVSNTDDPEMPASTLRAWTLGIICAIIFPGLNQFMFFRWPSTSVGQLVAQLLSYPVGRLWARYMPRKTIFGIQLNPGPFNVKEHVIIAVMAVMGGRSAYATDIVAVQRVYYKQTYGFLYQWMLVLSTQLIGFSIGGICRRFLVSPPSMIWPSNLVLCALFNTLHSQEYVGMGRRDGWSREKFFMVALAAGTVYYFFPGYLFTALSMFTWVCWIVPNNAAVKQMFGYSSGMGLSILTFDWAQIAYIGSPLATPWWSAANVAAGFVIFYWILTPILYYRNVWEAKYMPIMSRYAYDNTGAQYNATMIMDEHGNLDIDKYKAYSPLFIPTAFAVSYGLSFASISATIVHTILYLRKQLRFKCKGGGFIERPDIHARLMDKYKQVSDLWYLVVFGAMFALGVLTVELWPTQMPVWAIVLALSISFVYTIPIGIIQAITNQQITLNVVSELIAGYTLPGRPIPMMIFKTYGYITMSQALKFAGDFKLGHYMKIPPRTMFWCQIVATVIAGTVQLGVQSWMFSNIRDMCSPTQEDHFICPDTEVFYTASILWGLVGPAEQFSKGKTYYALLFFFLLGAVVPLITWMLTRQYPNSFWRYVNVPLMFGGTTLLPPATAVNFVPWAIVAFIFQYVIRRRHFSWWAKYNYVLSAALDASVAIGSLIIFFCLEFPGNGAIGKNTIQTWWGNVVWKNTLDLTSNGTYVLPPGATFGPTSW